MKAAKASRALGLMALAVIASPMAAAEDVNGWYVGGNVGRSFATIDDDRINTNLLGAGFASTSIEEDDRSTGYKVFSGYQFNRHFAIEGGYFDLGKFGYTATTVPAGTLSGEAKIRGLNLDLIGILPMTEKLSAFGRVGVTHAQARDSFRGSGAVLVSDPNPRKTDTNYKFGAGLQYAVTENFALRAEIERYRINDAVGNKGDIDLASIGLVYRFGGTSPAPRAAEPAYVAAAPAVVAPAAPPAPRKVTFSADSLFDFDQQNLKADGKRQLDQFASNLNGASYDVISVTGHTDRLGSDAYNTKLSARRAETVKAYLVNSAGIPAGKISATGAGEAEPVTKVDDCKGNKASKGLIACLQPDRRVEVEVVGTKQ
ncbi:outer membrane beta-barrel protein [Oxalobacteraceae bacterium R-40]|uniref:Outer membrane beta-barrel protein n=1 Tax=Keguizhuia sedimenti TaxID=3064264 RepID=A0ABU1BKN9_9BURK|nr:outer membrane beta-barrel protein [Oxalobacteraceae bacterium R-40]